MKHIQESIIGRKGSGQPVIYDPNQIKSGDILELRDNSLCIAYINPDDEKNSGLYYNPTPDKTEFIPIDAYNSSMNHRRVRSADIIRIWRDPHDSVVRAGFAGFKMGHHYSYLEKSLLQTLMNQIGYKLIYTRK